MNVEKVERPKNISVCYLIDIGELNDALTHGGFSKNLETSLKTDLKKSAKVKSKISG